jgi:diguanylate cyclase (GGDEF)-like protein/PAS domain S-box-containing protein
MFWVDTTDRANAVGALKRSEERYALAAAGANDGLWDWDLDRDELYFSSRWKMMLGLAPDAPCDHAEVWLERVHPDDIGSLRVAMDRHWTSTTGSFQHEHRVRHEDGTYRWMLCRGLAVRNAENRVVRMAGSQTDITDRMIAQDQLRHAALHDPLTGLPNRACFMEALHQAFERSRRHPEHQFAVLFLDVDGFKALNDSCGHLTGDTLLAGIAKRLETSLRSEDVIARLGGDEFTVLLNGIEDAVQAADIAERMQDSLRAPLSLEGHKVSPTVSIGIAMSAPYYTRPDEILRDADLALYRAKELGKARHHVFGADADSAMADPIPH